MHDEIADAGIALLTAMECGDDTSTSDILDDLDKRDLVAIVGMYAGIIGSMQSELESWSGVAIEDQLKLMGAWFAAHPYQDT